MLLKRVPRQFDFYNKPVRKALVNEGKIGYSSLAFQNKRTREYAAKIVRLQTGEGFDNFHLKLAFHKLRRIDEMENVVLVARTAH